MKTSNLIGSSLGAAVCLGLYACGGDHHGSSSQPSQPTMPMQPASMTLSVNDVLIKARSQSETDDPFNVDDGAVTVNPSNDEEADPVSVD
jgi:hypothetical protein